MPKAAVKNTDLTMGPTEPPEPPDTTEPTEAPRTARPPRLHFGQLQPAGHFSNQHEAKVPASTRMEDIFDSQYWQHYAGDIRPGDKVEVFCEDGSWECLVRVRFVSPSEVLVSQIYGVQFDDADVEHEESHIVKWISPSNKFGVVRRSDNAIVKDGFYPKSKARDFLNDHVRTVGSR